MSWLLTVASYLPSIKEPEKEQSLKQMLTWTGIVLLTYFTLSEISLWGADSQAIEQALQQLETFQTLLGAEIGSIITLGIGPIVTSSIIMQMVVGSDLLRWDTNTQEGKQKFQAAQKTFAYALCFITALGYVLSGTLGDVSHSPTLVALLTSQIALGGMIIIILDDLVQKWGFGSGTGLFIAGGVSKAVLISSISPLTENGEFYWMVDGTPVGALFQFATTLEFTSLIPILSSAVVFAIVVYMQSMKVEIPLTFGNVRGFGQKWPLKFLYTSVMPVILIAALIANVQIMGTALAGQDGCSPLGCFSQGEASSGLVAMLQAPAQFTTNLVTGGFDAIPVFSSISILGLSIPFLSLEPNSVFHVIFYLSVYTFGSIVFSIFWARTSGQGSEKVAEQIQSTGMKVPGFRKDTRMIQKVLDRYIPGLAVLSGAAVGFIAGAANMTRAAGGGTGILLTVMILYRMYEQLAQKHMEELHPAMKDFFK